MAFDLSEFLGRFDTGNIYNAQDMIHILRASDTGPEHILADILEAQDDRIRELERDMKVLVHFVRNSRTKRKR